ncbi:hypothetical protein COO60DRAFT_1503529 [Scenedesmus sp. NREL 46B-D3]|nr:hypothetical protein COO60DRAFT_1503529 [Scenedesmus sp. NREL 46B-D3]
MQIVTCQPSRPLASIKCCCTYCTQSCQDYLCTASFASTLMLPACLLALMQPTTHRCIVHDNRCVTTQQPALLQTTSLLWLWGSCDAHCPQDGGNAAQDECHGSAAHVERRQDDQGAQVDAHHARALGAAIWELSGHGVLLQEIVQLRSSWDVAGQLVKLRLTTGRPFLDIGDGLLLRCLTGVAIDECGLQEWDHKHANEQQRPHDSKLHARRQPVKKA